MRGPCIAGAVHRFLLKQCETFHLGVWEVSDGGLEWKWHNKYPTTIHSINSCVLSLSKLTKAGCVYRGLAGATLPESFFRKDDDHLSGGIEYGFTSTTPDRGVAVGYAKGKASTVFEARMGMVDRGADISWLSQFEKEREVCAARPLLLWRSRASPLHLLSRAAQEVNTALSH